MKTMRALAIEYLLPWGLMLGVVAVLWCSR